MTAERNVVRTVTAIPTSDGAGVNLKRSIGAPLLDHLDPFLLLDYAAIVAMRPATNNNRQEYNDGVVQTNRAGIKLAMVTNNDK